MPARVLLVDDDASIREVLGQALRSQGHSVHAVESCTGALAVLENQRPQVVILDLMMPVLGGWQFLEIMQQSVKLSDIPVVIITASEEVPTGGYRIVRKPFDVDAVLSAVQDCCKALD